METEIIKKLKKLQELAKRGVGAEAVSAEEFLQKLMQKYKITEEQLNAKEERAPYFFDSKGEAELLKQIAAKVIGFKEIRGGKINDILKGHLQTVRRLNNLKNEDYTFLCTTAEFVEISYLFSIYYEDITKHREAFTYAYFKKNNLLIDDPNVKEPTDEEIEIVRIANKLAISIDKKQVVKAIEA